MIVKGIIDEDFVNYKLPSMIIEFPHCDFKCNKLSGKQVCHNSILANAPDIKISIEEIVDRYLSNDITKAIIFQGLEPFESFDELLSLVKLFRENHCYDDVVIYTGYNKDEILNYIKKLEKFPNIIIKFGRFIPNQKHHLDPVLGVDLASDNQYAERIS